MKTEFLVGKALRPRGLKGELRFELYTSDPMRFRSIQQFKLGDKAFDVEKISVEGDFAYIKFVGIDTVEEAEKFRGKSLYADRSKLPKLGGGKVYIADIKQELFNGFVVDASRLNANLHIEGGE